MGRLKDGRVGATTAVADMDRAIEFYEGLARLDGYVGAWIKDPDGNLLAIGNG